MVVIVIDDNHFAQATMLPHRHLLCIYTMIPRVQFKTGSIIIGK